MAMELRWQNLILQRAPADKIIHELKIIPCWPSYDTQTTLVDFFMKYSNSPPPARWLKYFLKCLHQEIENNNEEVHDSIVEMIVQAALLSSEDDAGTVIFPLPNNQNALIHAKKIHNQVGMRLWTAGIFLSEIMLQLPFCEGRNLLELGAGTGCTGILLALSSKFKKILMTDFHPDVVENLQFNIDLNSHLLPSSPPAAAAAAVMSCETLDWAFYTDDDISRLLNEVPNPVILAADCIYSIDLGILLVNIICRILTSSSLSGGETLHFETSCDRPDPLEHFLTSSSSSSSSYSKFPFALVVQTVRQEDTFSSFLKYLELTIRTDAALTGLLEFQDITNWIKEQKIKSTFYYDPNEDVRVICIYRTSEVK
jgi:predicted nicotinamide N-methyase